MLIEYDYKCVKCGQEFSIELRSFREAFKTLATIRCPKCGDRFPKRIYRPPMINVHPETEHLKKLGLTKDSKDEDEED